MKVNVGFLLSYDYNLLKNSLPLVYKAADSIFLAVDKNRNTWAGNKITIPDDFFEWLKSIDVEQKICIYEDDFYINTLSTMQNETRERNMLAKKMGKGLGLQIDVDEYHVNFSALVDYLKKHKRKLQSAKAYQICPLSVDIYKILDDGVLCISDFSAFNSGSNHPYFIKGRKCKDQQKWYVPYFFIHQSWGRDKKELYFKLKNWGHNTDFDIDAYMNFWDSVNKDNFTQHKNFHPLSNKAWKSLEYYKGSTIKEVVSTLKNQKKVPYFYIYKKNLGQKLKYIFK